MPCSLGTQLLHWQLIQGHTWHMSNQSNLHLPQILIFPPKVLLIIGIIPLELQRFRLMVGNTILYHILCLTVILVVPIKKAFLQQPFRL